MSENEIIEVVDAIEEAAMHEVNVFGFAAFENDERGIDGEELDAFFAFVEDADEYVPFSLF